MARGLVLGLLVTTSIARADEDSVLPCRPTLACTADLATPGMFELEVGYQLRWFSAGGGVEHGTPFLMKVPLAHWIEVQLGSNGYTYSDSAHYFDDVIVAAKLHLLDQTEHRPSFAVTVNASIPTVDQFGYVPTYDAFVTAHASKDLGKLHLDLTIGLNVWQLEAPIYDQPWAAFAATLPVSKRVSLALEPHYFAYAAPLADRDAGVMAAVELAVRPWLVFDAALDAIYRDQRSVIAIAGVSVIPVRLWGPR